jgi:hypothetical protein
MSTTDCLIVFGPLLVLVFGMMIAFGIHHYNTIQRGDY